MDQEGTQGKQMDQEESQGTHMDQGALDIPSESDDQHFFFVNAMLLNAESLEYMSRVTRRWAAIGSDGEGRRRVDHGPYGKESQRFCEFVARSSKLRYDAFRIRVGRDADSGQARGLAISGEIQSIAGLLRVLLHVARGITATLGMPVAKR